MEIVKKTTIKRRVGEEEGVVKPFQLPASVPRALIMFDSRPALKSLGGHSDGRFSAAGGLGGAPDGPVHPCPYTVRLSNSSVMVLARVIIRYIYIYRTGEFINYNRDGRYTRIFFFVK